MTLAELKAKATELGLTPDEVRQYGNLSKKATWETAIAEFKQWEEAVDTHCEQMDIPQWTHPEAETVNNATSEAVDETTSDTQSVNSDPFFPLCIQQEPEKIVSEPEPTNATVDMDGWYRWDENLKVWIKENPEETLKDCYQPESESYRQQLLKRMKPYVGDCIKPEDFEQLKNEPLDETTASVYLGLLDGSERVLSGLITP